MKNTVKEQAALIVIEDDLPVSIWDEESQKSDSLLPISKVADDFFCYCADTLVNGNISDFLENYGKVVVFLTTESEELAPFRDLGLFFEKLKERNVYDRAVKLIKGKSALTDSISYKIV